MKTKKQVLDIYFVATENYTIRREQLSGVDHIVVPVVMMVEGVHSGSHGPILHLAEELGRFPESWDGIPVTIGHPNVNGAYVSANSPDVLQDWAVGRIFNTRIDGSALRAEAWINEVDLERISEETLERLNNNDVIEVSVGIFSDEEIASGVWNTEQYDAIARNHRPNHLALLPDEIGACSIEDGCGIRVNKKGETKVEEKDVNLIVNSDNQEKIIEELNQLGFSINKKVEEEPNPPKKDEGRVVTQRVIQKNNKKTMCTECVKKLADTLIANKVTAWNEDDREYLESQSEEQLEKMTPPVVKEPEVNTAKPTREDVLAVLSEKPMTTEEFMKVASPEVATSMREGLELRTNQKNEMVSQIMANADQWTEDELNAKELSELQKLHKVVMKDTEGAVYAGGGGIGGKTKIKNNNSPRTMMLPPGVKVKQEKE